MYACVLEEAIKAIICDDGDGQPTLGLQRTLTSIKNIELILWTTEVQLLNKHSDPLFPTHYLLTRRCRIEEPSVNMRNFMMKT